jgi:hypothetical protein
VGNGLLDAETACTILRWLVRGADGVTRSDVEIMQGRRIWQQLQEHPWFRIQDGRLTWSTLGRRVLNAMPHGGQRPPRPAGAAR